MKSGRCCHHGQATVAGKIMRKRGNFRRYSKILFLRVTNEIKTFNKKKNQVASKLHVSSDLQIFKVVSCWFLTRKGWTNTWKHTASPPPHIFQFTFYICFKRCQICVLYLIDTQYDQLLKPDRIKGIGQVTISIRTTSRLSFFFIFTLSTTFFSAPKLFEKKKTLIYIENCIRYECDNRSLLKA